MNCSLDFFHEDIRKSGSRIGFHSHGGFELVYYADGRGRTRIQTTEYEYGPGTFAVIRPGCRHDESRETATDVKFLVFFYDNVPVPLRNGLYVDRPDGWLAGLLGRMAEELAGKSIYSDMQLQCLLMEMIIGIGRMDNAGEPVVPDGKVAAARKYIDDYYAGEVDLPGLAAALGYSYDYFRHMFKDATGFSPMQYVVRKRIEGAKRLLLQTGKTITEIAMDCGFSNTPQFCMMFRKLVGETPKRFRQFYCS